MDQHQEFAMTRSPKHRSGLQETARKAHCVVWLFTGVAVLAAFSR